MSVELGARIYKLPSPSALVFGLCFVSCAYFYIILHYESTSPPVIILLWSRTRIFPTYHINISIIGYKRSHYQVFYMSSILPPHQAQHFLQTYNTVLLS